MRGSIVFISMQNGPPRYCFNTCVAQLGLGKIWADEDDDEEEALAAAKKEATT